MCNTTPYYCRINKTTYTIEVYADIHIELDLNENN